MLEVGYLAALLGGVLSILSPCSALLLPAFFAYACTDPLALLRRTAVFAAGLAALLVPLGLGLGALTRVLVSHRGALTLGAGVLLVTLGLLQLLGRGFGFAPVARLQQQLTGEGAGTVFALGATYGLAGFCSGPILGAVLTVAAASSSAVHGGALLAVYALGMTVPLFALALLWDRLGTSRRWLRGRAVSLAGREVHTTDLAAGGLFIVLGMLFVATEGTAGLQGLYGSGATELAFRLNELVLRWTNTVPDVLVGAVLLAAAALGVRRVRSRRSQDAPSRSGVGADAARTGEGR